MAMVIVAKSNIVIINKLWYYYLEKSTIDINC